MSYDNFPYEIEKKLRKIRTLNNEAESLQNQVIEYFKQELNNENDTLNEKLNNIFENTTENVDTTIFEINEELEQRQL